MYKIFLKVGDSCNLHCKYCMQEHSPNTYECDDEFILSLKEQYPDTIFCLLGGEPLLYKDVLRHIIDDLLNNKHINIVTNGKLLDEEWVSYFNDRTNVRVIVSWDGNSSSITRGYNVLDTNYNNTVRLKNLWISSLITNESCILDKISVLDKLNLEREKLGLEYSIPNIKLAFGVEYTKTTIRKISKELQQLKHGMIDNKLSKLWFEQAKNILDNTHKTQEYFCGANIAVLHYTISGDKRRCFFDDRLDNVNFPYINTLKEHCDKCEINRICIHQCPICLDNVNNFCLACKAFYSPFL